MKKLNILFVSMNLFVVACNDDFLQRTPGTNISDVDYWQSTNDLKMYANNYYNTFLNPYGGWGTIGIIFVQYHHEW